MMDFEYDSSQTILKNTEKLLLDNIFLDFTVKVDDVSLQCHRIFLAASSHFFRALLMSDMKEAKEGCVTINGISLKTFQHILKSMYTGKVPLTTDNFIDIWQAADQLQIDFIVTHCEDFATKAISVENIESVINTAKAFKSEKVLDALKSFMLNNFRILMNDKPIMELEVKDFNELIDSRDLKVENEDWVIQTVLKWVDYWPKEKCIVEYEHVYTEIEHNTSKENSSIKQSGKSLTAAHKQTLNKINQNERTQALTTLLKSVRTCLVSTPLLKDLLKHRLIINNTEARDILIDAVLYKTTHYNHGQWRTSAIHRAFSEWEHYGVVYVINTIFNCINACEEKFYKFASCSDISLDVTLVVFDSYLYASGVKDVSQTNSCLYIFCRNVWNKITEIPGRQLILVPYEQSIFILSKCSTEIYQLFPKSSKLKVEEFTKLPETIKLQQAVHYQGKVLIFSSVTVSGEEKTAVHQLDILTNKLTELEQLNGPAEQIISFNDDNNTYVLQTVGDLWSLNYSAEKVTFISLGRLWTIRRNLYGAMTYRKKLIVLGSDPTKEPADQKRLPSFKEYFNSITYLGINVPCSNFIPVTLPKDEMASFKKIITN
ncbi:kelch-like protein 40a [Physella acuta]|uniref:kelch-like protein 40a n=1 Tax=Physella acuta TaxID=109671 RepID=UPI0027DDFA0F|nr:kelch-like protein 40a [Physella acuta]